MYIFESDNVKFRLSKTHLDNFPRSAFTKAVYNEKTHELIKKDQSLLCYDIYFVLISDKSLKGIIRYMRDYPITALSFSDYTYDELNDMKKDAEILGLDCMAKKIIIKDNNNIINKVYNSLFENIDSFNPDTFYTVNLD